MRKVVAIAAPVVIGLLAMRADAATIEETLTIESPATIHPGDVVVVLATLQQTPSSPTLKVSSWSPNVTVESTPGMVDQKVHFLYASSFYSMTTKSSHATSTLLQANLVAPPGSGGAVPVNTAGFTFSFVAPSPGMYELMDSGTRQDSLGTENNAANTPFTVAGAVVPEPCSVTLLASGAIAVSLFGASHPLRRRRQTKRSQLPSAA